MGERRKVNKVLVGKPERKEPLGRTRHGWEDEIRMDLGKIGWRVWNEFNWLRKGTGGELL
jgi:hypothetical protein